MMKLKKLNSTTNDFFQWCDYLPYRAYDAATQLFYQEDSVGFILELSPLCGGSLEIDKALGGWLSHNLPEDALLETYLWASPHLDDRLNHYVASLEGLQKTLASTRRDYFQSKTWQTSSQSPALLRDFRLFMSVTFPEDAELPMMIETRNTLKHLLSSLNIFHQDLNAESLLSWVRALAFPFKKQHSRYVKSTPLNEQVTGIDVAFQVTPQHLSLDFYDEEPQCVKVSTFSVTEYPQQWQSLWMGECLGSLMQENLQIASPFLLHFVVSNGKQDNSKQKAALKLVRNEKLARSPLGKLMPRIKKVADDWQSAITAMDEGESLLQSYCQVVIWSKPEDSTRAQTLLRQCWQRLGFQLSLDAYLQLPYWLMSFPLSLTQKKLMLLRQNKRTKTVLSKSAASLMPLQGDYKGTQSPCLLLTGRRGQVFYFSPFDNEGGNYNTAVSGKSGSGKSVLMQEIMSGLLGLGGKVFVLDVGRSFERACHLHCGEFVAFDFDDPVNLNPFTHIQHFQESLAMLKPLLAAMASPESKLPAFEMALLEQAIIDAWALKQNNTTITTVAECLLKNKEKRAQDLGTLLFPYTARGLYGAFFEGSCSLNMRNSLIVLELEELKSKKDLQQIVLMFLMYHVTESMYRGNRKTPMACIIDEAWDLLRGELAGEMMETGCRRARKYRGAFITGTQSLRDFYQTPASQAAFDNSDNLLLLSQKEEAVDWMEREGTLAMTENLKTLLKSLKTRKGQYSEMLIKTPSGFSVARLMLDPFARTLYSSDPKVFTAIQEYRERGLSWEEAIQKAQVLEQS